MATQSLSVFLLKKTVRADAALQPDLAVSRHQALVAPNVVAPLFLKASDPKTPRWVRYLDDAVTPGLNDAVNSSASAVLMLEGGGRQFAVTFGHGRHLLAPDSYDERFGLRATINAIEPKSIKSIDKRSFDAIGTHTRTQAGISGSMDSFGLDVEQHLLRAVVGSPKAVHSILGKRITGMDALQFSTDAPLEHLPAVLEYALRRSEAKDYLSDFPWIDHVAEVTNPATIRLLNQELAVQVAAPGGNRIWLAVPEVIDWSRTAGFRYSSSTRRPLHHDLRLAQFLAELGNPPAFAATALKDHRVVEFDDADAELHRWTLYRCLNAEISLSTGTFVLSDAKWYKVDADFVARVKTYFDGLPRSARTLLDFNHAREEEYILAAAAGATDLSVMDQKLIPYVGRGKIELCDLLSNSRELIHVKRYGSSSVFSHHFAQAVVSAELLASDPEFREKAKAVVPPALSNFFDGSFDSRLCKVVLAIISRKKAGLDLPFFSKVNLRAAGTRLTGRGYAVELLKVQDARP